MKIPEEFKLVALYLATLFVAAFLLGGCANPAWVTVDTFLNVTAGPYYEAKVKADSELSSDEKEARLWELDALRRQVEEIQGTDTEVSDD